MLRHPDASSKIEEFSRPRFLPLVPDAEVQDAKRILIASGKVGHELRGERRRRKDTSTAIFFLDQLYPLPRAEITAALAEHPGWVYDRYHLMLGVWGYSSADVETRVVDQHVANLRRKLEAAGADGLLETVRGVGYRLRS